MRMLFGDGQVVRKNEPSRSRTPGLSVSPRACSRSIFKGDLHSSTSRLYLAITRPFCSPVKELTFKFSDPRAGQALSWSGIGRANVPKNSYNFPWL